MQIKVSLKDVIWNYAGVIVNLGSNLIMLPFILYFLGDEQIGLWYVFQSISSLSVMFDFGFNPTFARNVAYCWSGASRLERDGYCKSSGEKVNYGLLKQLIITSRFIYAILSVVVLLLFSVVGTFYIVHISSNLRGYNHIIAWAIWCVALFLNLYYGYFSGLLKGVGAVAESNKSVVIARLFQLVALIIFLLCGMDLVGVAMAYLLYGFLLRILSGKYFYSYRGIGLNLRKTEEDSSIYSKMEVFIIVWHNAWKEGGVAFANYFCNQAGTIVCSLYVTLEETGVYSLAVQLATAVVTFSYALYTSYQPSIQSAIVNENREKVKKDFSYVVSVFVILTILGSTALVLIVRPIIGILKPSMYMGWGILLCVCIYQFILKFRNAYTSYLSNSNRIIYFKSFIFSAILCVIFEFVLTGGLNWGIWGLIFAQILSQVVYNFWYWPLKVHRELNINLIELFETGAEEIHRRCKELVKDGKM